MPLAIKDLDPVQNRAAGALMAISKVDGQAIGASPVGPVTSRLRDLYWSKRSKGWHATAVDYRTV